MKNKLILGIDTNWVQAQAELKFGRELTKKEMDIFIEHLPEYIDAGEAIVKCLHFELDIEDADEEEEDE